MSENNQGPPPVPNNKPKGTANESTTPPPLPKAKIITISSPQDVADNIKFAAETSKNLPPKLPGKKNNTPPPLATSMPQNETGSAEINAETAKKLPPKLPNRKSKTPPPLAPSMPQNARQTIFLPNSQTSNPGAIQSGNKGKGKLFLFIFGVAAALILIVSISNGGGNDVPLDRGHAFERSDNQKNDSEDSDVGYSEREVQSPPEPETYAYDESDNDQTGYDSDQDEEVSEQDVYTFGGALYGASRAQEGSKTCSNDECNNPIRWGEGWTHQYSESYNGNCHKFGVGFNGEYCSEPCCEKEN
jgi:hypothetical protein